MDDSQTTQPSLLVRIRDAQDNGAWSQFVRIYSPLVYHFACRCGLQDADAADLTQDVLGTVAQSIGNFDYNRRRGSFRGWLKTVARTRMCNLLASRGRRTLGSGDTGVLHLLENQPASSDEEDCWQREYERSVFDWAAEQIRGEFQDPTWQAFWITSVEGKDIKQIALSLGMTVGAVYTARSRVLIRLKQKIRQVEE